MLKVSVQLAFGLGLAFACPTVGLELWAYGTVVDTRGAPVAGARATFTYYPDPVQVFSTLTQKDGSYRIDLSNLITVVEEETTARPGGFQLLPNYPNPFNPSTVIPYHLPEAVHVELSVYNILGHRLRTLVDDWQEAGAHAVVWDGHDQQGWGVAAGVYLYRLRAGQQVATGKMTLLDGVGGAPMGTMLHPAARVVQDTLAVEHRFTVLIYGDDIEPLYQREVPIPAHAPLDFEVTRRFFVRSLADMAALVPESGGPVTVPGSLYVTTPIWRIWRGCAHCGRWKGSCWCTAIRG